MQCNFLSIVGKLYQPVFAQSFPAPPLKLITPVGNKMTKEIRFLTWLQWECRDEIEEIIYPKACKYFKVFVFNIKNN